MGDYISESEYLQMHDDWTEVDQKPLYFKDTSKPTKIVGKQELYKCTKCGKFKPKSEFYKDNRVPCGIRNRCKVCYHVKSTKP